MSQPRELSSKHTKRRRVLLLGSGISKSISPKIHNKAFRELGLDLEYDICDISEEMLDSKLDDLLADEKILGFNVTIPFKEIIIKRISEIDPISRVVGAVNLVVISPDRRKMFGYNTDVDGVVASLSKLGLIGRSHQTAVVLGAGGAARACIYALINNGFEIIRILNRNEKRAAKTVSDFSLHFPTKNIEAAGLTKNELEKSLLGADLLVNTIPLVAEFPFELSFISSSKNLKCLDLNYRKNPPILKAAKRDGLVAIDGSLMLVEQAARSFEILTGISAPRKTMMLAAKKAG